jgi:hypothetical protein
MDILIENNAFHNISACLNKKCNDVSQIEDFIQLCIQIIFYEHISVSGLVPGNVYEKSLEIIEVLKSEYHIDNINFQKISENNEEKLVHEVSNQYYAVLHERLGEYNTSKDDALILLPKLSKEFVEKVDIVSEAIKTNSYGAVEKLYRQSSFSNDSSIVKIILHEKNIFDELVIYSQYYGWNEVKSYQLISDLRIITNKILSQENGKIYSPGVKRGRAEQKIIRIFSSRIEMILKKANYEALYPQSIEMPSIKDYLIEKGNSNPGEILKITCDLRKRFHPIRQYIQKMGKNNFYDSVGALNGIAAKLLEKMRTGNVSKPRKILENTATLGFGPVSSQVPIPDMPGIIKGHKVNVCVQAFTEIMQDMLHYNSGYSEKKLIGNCLE